MRGRRDGLTGRLHRAVGAWICVLMVGGVYAHPVGAQTEDDITASIRGGVVDAVSGFSLGGATVTLVPLDDGLGAPRLRVTDMSGFFAFDSIAPGHYAFVVAFLGYETVTDSLDITEDAELEVAARLSVRAIGIDPIDVEVASRAIGALVGFEQRRRTLHGTFFDREDIEASAAVEFTDLVRTIPGIRVVPVGRFGTRLLMRNCRPEFWLDGVQVSEAGDIDTFLKPEELEAVEVYKGSIVPSEFGTTQCGTVAAWSRHAQTGASSTSLKRQLIMAGGIILGFLIIRNQSR